MALRLSQKHSIHVFQTGNTSGASYHVYKITPVPFFPHQGGRRYGYAENIFRSTCYPIIVLWFTLLCIPDLIRNRYDWVIPINGGWQVLICRILRTITGCKILISGHAGVGRDDWLNISIGKPNIFVALSPRAEKWAKKFKQPFLVHYIPNGVDIKKFNPDGPKVHLNLNKPVLLCVSQLIPYKRVDFLIRSVSLIKELNFLIIGDGPLSSDIDLLGKRLLGSRYERISSASHSQIPAYYRSVDFFSLPSVDTEAFGLVYLEALSSNLPVIAPDDDNRRIIIGEAGTYFHSDNQESCVNALKLALSKNWGNLPRKQAEKFTWDKITLEYEKLLKAD
ncbi:MAG: glycosyltransferase [Bacteroidota bacterium]